MIVTRNNLMYEYIILLFLIGEVSHQTFINKQLAFKADVTWINIEKQKVKRWEGCDVFLRLALEIKRVSLK